MENPNYYAVIPANVRYDKELKPMAKLLYGEIAALAQKDGKCWATNNYFAELYGMAKASISRLISDLAEKGYISIEIVYKEGTHEIINRYIQICGEGIHKKVDTPIDENVYTPIDEKVKENNTSNKQYKNEQYKNNKREEVSKDTSKRKFMPPTLEDVKDYAIEKNLSVIPEDFYEYFEAGNWFDSKGNKVKNWKQKMLTWNSHNKSPTKQTVEHRREEYSSFSALRKELESDKSGDSNDFGSDTEGVSEILSEYEIE